MDRVHIPRSFWTSNLEIGRASCRESVDLGGRRIIKKKKTQFLYQSDFSMNSRSEGDPAFQRARAGCFFFFQAEDGIRDPVVTGVQTCALPICQNARGAPAPSGGGGMRWTLELRESL